ncbi:GNAT family N-acetyltransferase [Treponema putidum]|uniref:GNAT family N-acetyltransferase n=1 Tax=Treponema putidum TaxID=221027 RepID=A0AAE9SI69_9SPIR|nr:GNAT family N-acetyltransferase [Treponema putidum]UTY32581.1 GNAT family N-acetyltransferase [Treponema putidum]
MNIRLMHLSDYEAVYGLWISCAGMGLNNFDDSKEGIAAFLKRNPETCFVAKSENPKEIAGVILAGNDGRRGYIYHTAVHPNYRKRGIGSRLVASALDALKKLGIHKAALVVFEKNKDGNAFWEQQGFSVRDDLVYRNKALSAIKRIDT